MVLERPASDCNFNSLRHDVTGIPSHYVSPIRQTPSVVYDVGIHHHSWHRELHSGEQLGASLLEPIRLFL